MDKLANPDLFQKYLPAQFYWEAGEPRVNWIYCDQTRFKDSFFESTLEECMRRPFNLLFKQQTSAAFLEHWAQTSPGLPPAGLIYHVSRCGSTLLANMLSQLPDALALSEPAPLDAVLRSRFKSTAVTETQQIAWTRGIVSGLAQRRSPELERVYIKLDAWHLLSGDLLDKAFPAVPSIILYRDPVEVLVSTLTQRGLFLVPNPQNCALFGIPFEEAVASSVEEYCARVLGILYAAAVCRAEARKSMLMNYTELPEAAWTKLPAQFGFQVSPAVLEQFQSRTKWNSKTRMAYTPDAEIKQASASATARECAERWIYPHYRKLESLRLG